MKPEWAKWMATDLSGHTYYYSHKPVATSCEWYISEDADKNVIQVEESEETANLWLTVLPSCLNWRDTLEAVNQNVTPVSIKFKFVTDDCSWDDILPVDMEIPHEYTIESFIPIHLKELNQFFNGQISELQVTTYFKP